MALKKDILDHQSNTKPTWIKKYNANLINCYHLNECAKSLVICLSKCDDTFSGEEAVSIETLNQDLTAVNQEEGKDSNYLFSEYSYKNLLYRLHGIVQPKHVSD